MIRTFSLVGCPVEFINDAENFLVPCLQEAGLYGAKGNYPVIWDGKWHASPTYNNFTGWLVADGITDEQLPRLIIGAVRERLPDRNGGSFKVTVYTGSKGKTITYDEAEQGYL